MKYFLIGMMLSSFCVFSSGCSSKPVEKPGGMIECVRNESSGKLLGDEMLDDCFKRIPGSPIDFQPEVKKRCAQISTNVLSCDKIREGGTKYIEGVKP